MFNDQAFDSLHADRDDSERPASAAQLAGMEFEPQAGLSSLDAGPCSKTERDLRTSLAFASVFVKLTEPELVAMLRRVASPCFR
jgi:hypothetical protein